MNSGNPYYDFMVEYFSTVTGLDVDRFAFGRKNDTGYAALITVRDEKIIELGALCWPTYLRNAFGAAQNMMPRVQDFLDACAKRLDNRQMDAAVMLHGYAFRVRDRGYLSSPSTPAYNRMVQKFAMSSGLETDQFGFYKTDDENFFDLIAIRDEKLVTLGKVYKGFLLDEKVTMDNFLPSFTENAFIRACADVFHESRTTTPMLTGNPDFWEADFHADSKRFTGMVDGRYQGPKSSQAAPEVREHHNRTSTHPRRQYEGSGMQ